MGEIRDFAVRQDVDIQDEICKHSRVFALPGDDSDTSQRILTANTSYIRLEIVYG